MICFRELNKVAKPEPSEYTEFTIDLTTKVDSCVELSSVQVHNVPVCFTTLFSGICPFVKVILSGPKELAGGFTVNHIREMESMSSNK